MKNLILAIIIILCFTGVSKSQTSFIVNVTEKNDTDAEINWTYTGSSDYYKVKISSTDDFSNDFNSPEYKILSSETNALSIDNLTIGSSYFFQIVAVSNAVETISSVYPLIPGQNLPVANSDRAALFAIYNALNGPNWDNNTNWLSDEPLNTWHGVIAHNDRVKQINLQDSKISGSIPSEIGNLEELRWLRIVSDNDNFITTIPTAMENLINLYDLWIQRVGARQDEIQLFPTAIQGMVALRNLNLNNCGIGGELPDFIGGINSLLTMRLSNNHITGALPSNLGNLPSLYFLDFKSNLLSGSLPHVLSNIGSLRHLDLSDNSFNGNIPTSIGNLPVLQMFNINNNEFSGPIPSFINSSNPNHQLIVTNNGFTFNDFGLVSNVNSFYYNPQKKVDLIVNGNQLQMPGGGTSFEWYKDGVIMPNSTSNLITVSESGIYRCRSTDSNYPDLTLESTDFTFTPSSARIGYKDDLVAGFAVFPVPAMDIVNIAIDEPIEAFDLTIISLDGAILQSDHLEIEDNRVSFSVKKFSNGFYLVKGSINDKSFMSKFNVQH